MAACNGLFVYHFLGLASLAAVFYFSLLGAVDLRFPGLLPSSASSPQPQPHDASLPFVERRGVQLFLEGRPFYINGWNSYWLMDQSVEPKSRHRVSGMFRAATGMGLTVCRTWAFNDGAYNALQVTPGRFDERVFQALDRVVVEARQHGVRLILSLANNLDAYGGKTQYVRWAWDEGVGLTASNDSFFFDPAIRDYFKVYLKALLTRKNHLTGVQYKDDPTILAWELMNEPRCITDPSGNTLQRWIEEMAAYVKSIDKRHLLTVGTEGFYGPTSPPEKLGANPGHWFNNYGLDFIRNSKISDIDFASVHLYPDNWLLQANLEEKLKFVTQWVSSHIEDGDKELNKPVLLTEFGLSHLVKGFDQSHRDAFYKAVYDIVYESARRRRRVAARRGGHEGLPGRLRHRGQREAVDAEAAQGAVLPAGRAEVREGGQEDPPDGLRLISLVQIVSCVCHCVCVLVSSSPWWIGRRNGVGGNRQETDRREEIHVACAGPAWQRQSLVCSAPTSADLPLPNPLFFSVSFVCLYVPLTLILKSLSSGRRGQLHIVLQ